MFYALAAWRPRTILFESLLGLLVAAMLLLRLSRRIGAPYPAMLALAGAAVAALPWAPPIAMEPRLALALFITPALFDAAFDTAPRALLQNWLAVCSLALIAVLLTTAAVAWAGWGVAGLPLAAAVTLGAIVAPPDAAAASATLSRFDLPRSSMTILQGESLLNDASALLLFGVASAIAMSHQAAGTFLPELLLAVPGGVLLGLAAGGLYIQLAAQAAGTLAARILEFVATFGVWVVAEHLHVSPILAVVTYAMLIARVIPLRQSARDRVHSYSVWAAAVFVLNVLAFLLMGLQARVIFDRLGAEELFQALQFSLLVLGIVIAVRALWVVALAVVTTRLFRATALARHIAPVRPWRERVLIAWCGMRGLVTLATAFALPAEFPGRDVIVLSAFVVVIGTLVLQGMTIAPLIRLLKLDPDTSLNKEVSVARQAMIDAALGALAGLRGDAADAVRAEYRAAQEQARDRREPQGVTEHDRLRSTAVVAQRRRLAALRQQGEISDDAFHQLQEELDWAELNAAPRSRLSLSET
jgi:CPA1 family monovalent cation:H+ antiporter